MTKNLIGALVLATTGLIGAAHAGEVTLYSNGFETDTSGWESPTTRVSSGTGGTASADGGFHATVGEGAFTRWGGYNYGAGNAVPTVFKEYRTSVDIYLNVGGGYQNDQRFDYSSAINGANGVHLRDFIFTGGFYDDVLGGGNRFVLNTTNNAPGTPVGAGAVTIGATGWYTFSHHFYDNQGVLAVDMEILDANALLVGNWTLSNPSDVIGAVGGNRYGWFVNNALGPLAIDNAQLDAIPEPASLALVGIALVGAAASRRRRKS